MTTGGAVRVYLHLCCLLQFRLSCCWLREHVLTTCALLVDPQTPRSLASASQSSNQRFSFVAYNTGPTALLFSKQAAGPVIRIGEHNVSGGVDDGGGLGCGGNVYLQNIGVSGYECGLHIINSAWVRLRNVGVKAAVHTGGDSNAAMVRERASILTRSQCRGPTFTKPSSRRY